MNNLTGRVQEARGFSNEVEFTNYVHSFFGLKSEDRQRILDNQNTRFRETQKMGIRAEYSCFADFFLIFGMKWLVDLQTSVLTGPMNYEERRRINLVAPHLTLSDYRAAGVVD